MHTGDCRRWPMLMYWVVVSLSVGTEVEAAIVVLGEHTFVGVKIGGVIDVLDTVSSRRMHSACPSTTECSEWVNAWELLVTAGITITIVGVGCMDTDVDAALGSSEHTSVALELTTDVVALVLVVAESRLLSMEFTRWWPVDATADTLGDDDNVTATDVTDTLLVVELSLTSVRPGVDTEVDVPVISQMLLNNRRAAFSSISLNTGENKLPRFISQNMCSSLLIWTVTNFGANTVITLQLVKRGLNASSRFMQLGRTNRNRNSVCCCSWLRCPLHRTISSLATWNDSTETNAWSFS